RYRGHTCPNFTRSEPFCGRDAPKGGSCPAQLRHDHHRFCHSRPNGWLAFARTAANTCALLAWPRQNIARLALKQVRLVSPYAINRAIDASIARLMDSLKIRFVQT